MIPARHNIGATVQNRLKRHRSEPVTISGIFASGGDTKFGFICDIITLWVVVVPLSLIAAFWLKLPVLVIYVLINMDEWVKFPAVRKHFRKYNWVRDLTRTTEEAE